MKTTGFRKTRMSGKVRIFSYEKTTVVDLHLIALQHPTFQTMYLCICPTHDQKLMIMIIDQLR